VIKWLWFPMSVLGRYEKGEWHQKR
jgi:hypothetical protein